jgi:hypothetical protein
VQTLLLLLMPLPVPLCCCCCCRFRYCGLWRTQVLDVSVTGRPKPFTSLDGGGGGTLLRMARILVGDPGGAQTEMLLPYDSR